MLYVFISFLSILLFPSKPINKIFVWSMHVAITLDRILSLQFIWNLCQSTILSMLNSSQECFFFSFNKFPTFQCFYFDLFCWKLFINILFSLFFASENSLSTNKQVSNVFEKKSLVKLGYIEKNMLKWDWTDINGEMIS